GGGPPAAPASLKQFAGEVRKRIDAEYDQLDALYKCLHSAPELSLKEEEIFIFFIGTVPPARVAEARLQPLPALHFDQYYPVPEPTIKAGVLSMSVAVFNLLDK